MRVFRVFCGGEAAFSRRLVLVEKKQLALRGCFAKAEPSLGFFPAATLGVRGRNFVINRVW